MSEHTTVLLRRDGKYLLERRDGSWSFPTVAVDGDVVAVAADRAGVDPDSVRHVRRGAVDGGPVDLLDCEAAPPETTDAQRWASPIQTAAGSAGRWAVYAAVRPTVETIRSEVEYGSAWLSLRALEVLRDEAVAPDGADDWDDLVAVATALCDAQPTMAVVHNRVARAMASADDRTPRAVARSAQALLPDARRADARAAERAAAPVEDRRVCTVSLSGTVISALEAGDPDSVLVTVSETDREGVHTAERLAGSLETTLTTDAAAPWLVEDRPVDVVLCGADAILPGGAVVNKVGTYAVALAAGAADVPVYAVAARDKVQTTADLRQDRRPPGAVYDGDRPVEVANPVFDVTPSSALTAIVTEEGVLEPEAIPSIADELAADRDRAGLGRQR